MLILIIAALGQYCHLVITKLTGGKTFTKSGGGRAPVASPLWPRHCYARKQITPCHTQHAVNYCRIIKPANVTSIPLLVGIAPPHIRRTVASRVERQRQTTQTSHQLYDHAQLLATGVARIFVGGGAPGRRHPALHQSCTS